MIVWSLMLVLNSHYTTGQSDSDKTVYIEVNAFFEEMVRIFVICIYIYSCHLLSSSVFSLSLFSLSLHRSGVTFIALSTPPSPLRTVPAFHFDREKTSALSSLVDSRRIASTHAIDIDALSG